MMFRHILQHGGGEGRAILSISGHAVFTRAQEMEQVLGGALEACRHLTIDLEGIEEYDSTFRVLLCSLHRRSELEQKTLAIRGALPGRESEQARQAGAMGCLRDETNTRCHLWEKEPKGKR